MFLICGVLWPNPQRCQTYLQWKTKYQTMNLQYYIILFGAFKLLFLQIFNLYFSISRNFIVWFFVFHWRCVWHFCGFGHKRPQIRNIPFVFFSRSTEWCHWRKAQLISLFNIHFSLFKSFILLLFFSFWFISKFVVSRVCNSPLSFPT